MLLLDIGNSRCKWAYVKEGRWQQQGVIDNDALDSLPQQFARLPVPTRILISNVAGDAVAASLRAACAIWPVEPAFVQAQAQQCGVRNSYREPQQLGSDRWLALIAAWHRVQGTCLVVNCGTATTVDALSAQGEFMGGLILPGIALMQRSLSSNTAQLDATAGALRDFPQATADAILSGAVRATQGAIMQQHGLLQAGSNTVACLISGGSAQDVLPGLALPAEHAADLVLHGLQILGESEV